MKFDKTKIKSNFDPSTFQKGESYFNSNRVLNRLKIKNKLVGKIRGNSQETYHVEITVNNDTIKSKCSCPVGYMCKHSVALLLAHHNDENSFFDLANLITILSTKSKEELLMIFKNIILQFPEILSTFENEDHPVLTLDLDKITDQILDILYETDLSYDQVFDVSSELGNIEKIADELQEQQSYFQASYIYLKLIDGVITAFDIGADDSSGSLGFIADECIESYNKTAPYIVNKKQKQELAKLVQEIRNNIDYGLDTDQLFDKF